MIATGLAEIVGWAAYRTLRATFSPRVSPLWCVAHRGEQLIDLTGSQSYADHRF